ncbi:uncharacterized protein LOC125947701 [Dermacentor silvarum]|uniref:uncharacterized protein LOC125947701 n=1 Tax=Dermacentor silvarum TaxID=543639 RepID=UPI0021013337|nr:uncharacterized protein LOC125947701 [Dermacentor silvarum]
MSSSVVAEERPSAFFVSSADASAIVSVCVAGTTGAAASVSYLSDVMLMLKYELMDKITRDTRAILALDLEKAFDHVNHSHILNSIREAGLGTRFYNYVSSFLRDRTATIQLGSMGSKQFNLGPRGTPQGAVISPFLFNLSMRALSRQLSQIDGISHAFYADDITVWSTSGSDGHIEERLQEAVNMGRANPGRPSPNSKFKAVEVQGRRSATGTAQRPLGSRFRPGASPASLQTTGRPEAISALRTVAQDQDQEQEPQQQQVQEE